MGNRGKSTAQTPITPTQITPLTDKTKVTHQRVKAGSRGTGLTQTGNTAAKDVRGSVHLHWRLSRLKQGWSLCDIGRGGTGLSAVLNKNRITEQMDSYATCMGRNGMRSLYIYICVARDWCEQLMIMIMIMNLYSAKTIEE